MRDHNYYGCIGVLSEDQEGLLSRRSVEGKGQWPRYPGERKRDMEISFIILIRFSTSYEVEGAHQESFLYDIETGAKANNDMKKMENLFVKRMWDCFVIAASTMDA